MPSPPPTILKLNALQDNLSVLVAMFLCATSQLLFFCSLCCVPAAVPLLSRNPMLCTCQLVMSAWLHALLVGVELNAHVPLAQPDLSFCAMLKHGPVWVKQARRQAIVRAGLQLAVDTMSVLLRHLADDGESEVANHGNDNGGHDQRKRVDLHRRQETKCRDCRDWRQSTETTETGDHILGLTPPLDAPCSLSPTNLACVLACRSRMVSCSQVPAAAKS